MDKWINFNVSTGLIDLVCGENKIFFFVIMECVSANYYYYGYECGYGEVFCFYSVFCKNKIDCVFFRELNYIEVFKNDFFGKDDNIF